MNIGTVLKKNKLLLLVALMYLTVLILSPDKAAKSINNSVYYLVEMMQVLPVIFLLTVVIEAMIPKEMIMRGFGEKSGFRGNLLALLLGSISAGPIYAAFPISKALLGKGASIPNIVIILSTWAVIKLPMLANEAKFLGVDFMILRWVLTVIAIFLMAYITGVLVKKKDMPAQKEKSRLLEIREDYCIGCGLCVRLLPEYYLMKENKAVVIKMPDEPEAMLAILASAEKCPSKAIIINKQEEKP
ncbi:MAG: permease [Methanobrevibacter sp.]|uniref:permease n=1 Tax=Methanobrevibacter sp. TaxID=66852 RepID=UPI002B1E96EA|nr:permease [Methanobrevibacter sp.]MEA4958010.1 permease [Methanobrevibacter sp.]